MIEPTDEMRTAMRKAMDRRAQEAVALDESLDVGSRETLNAGLAAVLAIVERDQPTSKAGPGEDACGKADPFGRRTCERRARHDVCIAWVPGGVDAWQVDYDDLVGQIGPLRALLAQLVDEDPCWLDHHGYCQAHGLHSPPCPHQVAKELLGHA